MPINGIATEILTVGRRSVRSKIFITPDITDLGIDWQRKSGSTHWDHAKRRIKFGRGEWIPLRTGTEANEYRTVSRIYVETDVVLRPKQKTDVPVRVGRSFMQGEPLAGVTESYKIPNLSRVYSSRTLLPARTSELKVRVINADDRTQTLKKGTSLGQLDPNAEVFVPRSMRAERSAEVDVVCEIMDKLPKELTEIQRKEIRQLFRENEAVFSKGEYDIKRTPHVECRIDTGEHRPFRQNLCRHAFAHLDAIDEQVAEMTKHGIIKPAASPWASNVVLVRKKDGTLLFV